MDRTNVRMIEGGGRLGLMNKTGFFLGRAEGLGGEKLESDSTLELRVFGLVDHAHAAFPEFLEDLVMRNGLADQWQTPEHGSGLKIATYGTAIGRRHQGEFGVDSGLPSSDRAVPPAHGALEFRFHRKLESTGE